MLVRDAPIYSASLPAGSMPISRPSISSRFFVPLENPETSERQRIILRSEFSPSMPTSLLALLITLGSILRSRLDLQLEILALRHQIGVLERSVHKRPDSLPPIVFSGSRSTASGAIGVRRCSSSSRKRLWPGIARASAYFGVGKSGTDNKDGRRSPARLET